MASYVRLENNYSINFIINQVDLYNDIQLLRMAHILHDLLSNMVLHMFTV